MKAMFRSALFATLVLAVVLPAAPAAAQPVVQDVITVGNVTGGPVVDVPVYIRDVSGTPLGIDQPAGSKIQAYSIKVDYTPSSAIQSVTFTRDGITESLTPTFESSPSTPGSISLIDTFDETTDLIPFTLNAPAPGNLVGVLHVTLSPSAFAGEVIPLTLDATLTQLSNEAGTTSETTTNGFLALVAGSITVQTPAAPTLATWGLILLAGALAFVALRIRM